MKIRPTNNIKLDAGVQDRFQHLYDSYCYVLSARMTEQMIATTGARLERFMARYGIEGFQPAECELAAAGVGAN